MIQNLLLWSIFLLCILLLISLFQKPLDKRIKNPCGFKIFPPKFTIDGNKKKASFSIGVEKIHKYFINFPLMFKFYSSDKFITNVKIYYFTPDEERQLILDKRVEYNLKSREFITYITDVIIGKLFIDIELEIESGNPTILFEIMENNTCKLVKEHKLEIKFPES